ncbi:MAG: RNase adapter RapZ [Oscillospiraceae bacterium]|nr:RNase adapter RapZ [Oscillospiraceae bacterium]MBQ4310349.1 RNase adapter RapZ [Oscillospiraceae bacterium]MCR5167941.1 RNase adapter RapZ [Oscillospiraceae bacterium]
MKFLVVTGLSGAGKSGAVNVLEDIGFYCIDNIPPELIPKFAEICLHSGRQMKKVAIVTDIRGGDMFPQVGETLEYLKTLNGIEVSVMFLDASDDTLIRRYKETRRRHPLDEKYGGDLEDAIAEERRVLGVIRDKADYYVDTTDLSMSQLRENIKALFLNDPGEGIAVKVMSFGYKYGISREADLVFDVRCLPNPFYIEELKFHTGQEDCVRDYVMSFEQSMEFEAKLFDLMDFLIPLYIREGKTSLVIAFGCTGGKHRSVTFAERMYDHLSKKGIKTRVWHRDIKNR